MNLDEESITILKYRNGKKYQFFVMDKFDEADEPTRLDKMIAISKQLQEDLIDYQQVWIKTCPIFPTR